MTQAETIAILRKNADAIRAYGATALFLFGSAARDEMGPASDVDLFIEYDPAHPPSLFDLSGLSRVLSGALNRPVDLGTRDGLHPRLRSEIERTSMRVV